MSQGGADAKILANKYHHKNPNVDAKLITMAEPPSGNAQHAQQGPQKHLRVVQRGDLGILY
jgi:hypothetical protein